MADDVRDSHESSEETIAEARREFDEMSNEEHRNEAISNIGESVTDASEVVPEGPAREIVAGAGQVTQFAGDVLESGDTADALLHGDATNRALASSSVMNRAGHALEGSSIPGLSTVGHVLTSAAALTEGITHLASMFSGRAEQLRAEFEFEVADVDHMPPFKVSTFTGGEELHTCYAYKIRLLIEKAHPDADFNANILFGKSAKLVVKRGDLERKIHGLIEVVTQGNSSDRFFELDVVLVPALAFLRQSRNRRIFQNKTIPEVVTEVVTPYLESRGRKLVNELIAEYPKHETITQWDESDLDFVSRILASCGATFSFETQSNSDAEAMVLTDDNATFLRTPSLTPNGPVLFEKRRTSDVSDSEKVHVFTMTSLPPVDRVELADFLWTANEIQQLGEKAEVADSPFRVLKVGDAIAYTPSGSVYEVPAQRQSLSALAETSLQTRRDDLTFRGESVITGLAAGSTFVLEGHPDSSFDLEYLVVSVKHEGRVRSEGHGESAQDEYRNIFECIPYDFTTYRPTERPFPNVSGLHSALVIASDEASNEEIHTDVHGRILVKFAWDRPGKSNGKTAWLRVMQQWAGPGYGSLFVPRVGNEVMVSFVDGNPSRPIVVGSLYNTNSVPPFGEVDADKTRSGIRTLSSPSSDGYNELSFQDAAGEEEIRLQAQRDLNTKIKRNQTESIGSNLSVSVGGNETHTVTGNETHTVKKRRHDITEGDRVEDTWGHEQLLVSLSRMQRVCNDSSDFVEGSYLMKVDHAITQHATNFDVAVTEKAKIFADQNVALQSKDTFVKVTPDFIELKIGTSLIKMTSSSIEIQADSIKLAAGETKVELSASDAKVESTNVAIEAGAAADIKGTNITVEASAATNIKGAAINLN